MTGEERAKKSVDAAIRRFEDSRVTVFVQQNEEAGSSVLSAGEAVKKSWKPIAEELLDHTKRRVGLEDAPGDFDCDGMEAVMWHMQELARAMFNEEMRRRGVDRAARERWLRLLTLMKEKS